jgi:hypothetical protein
MVPQYQRHESLGILYASPPTVEQKVVMLQDRKRDIAAGAFSSVSQVDVVNSSSRLQVRTSSNCISISC